MEISLKLFTFQVDRQGSSILLNSDFAPPQLATVGTDHGSVSV